MLRLAVAEEYHVASVSFCVQLRGNGHIIFVLSIGEIERTIGGNEGVNPTDESEALN